MPPMAQKKPIDFPLNHHWRPRAFDRLHPIKPYAPKRAAKPKSFFAKAILSKSSLGKSVGGSLVGYNALVFVTSVCVMTLELTASRLIGKHVGSSLHTWTSVIGVVLAGGPCLEIGSVVGWPIGTNAAAPSPGRTCLAVWHAGSVLWLDQLERSRGRIRSVGQSGL